MTTRHRGRESLRQHLRQASSEAHARVDALFGALDLSSLAGYRRFLEATAAALLPLEAALGQAGVARLFPDWPQRSRTAALLADLDKIGGVASVRLPVPQRFDDAAMLGAMYVLEGSRLGALVLLRTVRRSADSRLKDATAYLTHGTGHALWPSFLEQLEEHGKVVRDQRAVIEGALQAFGLFERAAHGLVERESVPA